MSSSYPYGISKLQGSRRLMQLADENFSVISLAQGNDFRIQPAHALGSDHQHDVQGAP